MSKLRLGVLLDEKPVKVTVKVSASIYRDLVVYAEALSRETGQEIDVARLVAPMLARFMAADRGFARARRSAKETK